MKPVLQTRHGAPHGNCFAACVASILERPIEEVDVDVASCRKMSEVVDKVALKANCTFYGMDHEAIEDGVVKTSERYGILAVCTDRDPKNPNSLGHCVVCEIGENGKLSLAFNPEPGPRRSLEEFSAAMELRLVRPNR